MEDGVRQYLKSIEKDLAAGITTEHTHRPALEAFLESLGTGVNAINEPGRVACGAPDFLVTRSPGPLTVGYVEAKDVGVSLDEAERSDQIKRYRRSLGNLVLSDYLEFRWYVDGEWRKTARLARPGKGAKLTRDKQGEAEVISLLQGFLAHAPQPISTPKELAERTARLTHLVRDLIVQTFEAGQASDMLADLRGAFAQALIPDLDQPAKVGEFADMLAQTIAYGLFAARCNHHGPQPFQRLGAASEIPKTNPLLRRLFETITGTELDDEPYAPFVDDLVQLLAHADMEAILSQFGKRSRQEDPVVHFYETFLASYDPKLRELRGVYYTPEPVVSYIVRSVDYLLRTRFGLPDGLADTSTVTYERETDGEHPHREQAAAPRVLVLDPACGTGTFLYAVVDLIRERFMRGGNAGMWSGFVKEHLLPRLFGFELLMAPYAVAHLKLGMQLAGQDLADPQRQAWAYDFSGQDRLGVYLTNTLEEAERWVMDMFGPLRVLTEEANAAARVKRDLPILVVLGNPPYSGHSANRSWEAKNGKRVPTFIGKLVQDYYFVDGKRLDEKNPKWLQDDYVKFVRWGEWRIRQSGAGILAFITNHGYLDNPTFRGMRQALMNAFTHIYVLNLHGNTKKKERAPDGSADENVFDIQQGVAIGIFVKEPGKAGPANVYHAELWGSREGKYQALAEMGLESTPWVRLQPPPPFYPFLRRDLNLQAEYAAGWKLTDVFPKSSVGIVTARDHLTIHWSPEEVWQTVTDFARLPPEEARARYGLGEDAQDWKVALAQADLRASGPDRSRIAPIRYRPFDLRYTYYTGKAGGFICRPRPEVMRHMLVGGNVAFHVCRQAVSGTWQHVLATGVATDDCYVSNKTRERGYTLPLYLRATGQEVASGLYSSGDRRPNLSPAFLKDVESRLDLAFLSSGRGDLETSFGPEDVFDYIYAVLHSATYRSRYAEFLKTDFPRIPFTSDRDAFRRLCGLGRELVALHLLEPGALSRLITHYPVKGDDTVAAGYPKYLAPGEPEPGAGQPLAQGRVYINKAQYFEGIRPEVWQFHVGGYQVCEKWLKDRRGRKLSYDDLTHYQKVVVALKETIRLMQEIDEAIPGWPME